MIDRYSLTAMKNIWEEENKYKTWLKIELLVCEALFKSGKIDKNAIENIRSNARYSLDRIQEIEKVTRHDVLAFTTAVGENLGEYSRYFHRGLTSSDILDTSLALMLKQSVKIIIDDIENLIKYVPVKSLNIILHDSFNPKCRKGMITPNYNDNKHVHYVEIDFIHGGYISNNINRQMWGGFAHIILLAEKRLTQLKIHQSQKELYRIAYLYSIHFIKNSPRYLRPIIKLFYK